MKKLIFGAALCFCTLVAQAQEVGSVLQIFACNLAAGKTQENVWQTMEMVRDRATAADDENFGIFLWLPFRSGAGFDYIWGIVNTDMTDMAAGAMNYVTSGNAAVMGPRFAALGNCSASVNFSEMIRDGQVSVGEDRNLDAIVETASCNVREGSDMDDVRSAIKYWQGQMDEIESEATATYEAFLVTPFRGGSGDMDFGWIGSYPDVMTFGKGSQDYMASKEGQAADERFNKVSRCRTNLWAGYWIMAPENQK